MSRFYTTDDYREKLEKVTMEDDCFFTKCLAGDNVCTSLILRIILNRDDLTVLVSETQEWYQNLIGHSAKLDIWPRDKDGIMYYLKSIRLRQNIEGEADGIRKVVSNLIADTPQLPRFQSLRIFQLMR